MKIKKTITATIFLIFLASPLHAASFDQVKSAAVIVEELREDAQKCDINKDLISSSVSNAFRRNGYSIAPESNPYIYANVNIIHNNYLDLCVYSVSLSVQYTTVWMSNNKSSVNGSFSVCEKGSVGSVGSGLALGAIRQVLDALSDLVINCWATYPRT